MFIQGLLNIERGDRASGGRTEHPYRKMFSRASIMNGAGNVSIRAAGGERSGGGD